MAQIPRSGLGPHYFLHQKSKSTFAVDGSPIAGACLFDRNFESFGLCSAGGRRSGGSCPYSLRSLQKDFSLRIGQESQNQFEQDPKRQSPRWIQLAKRLRCVSVSQFASKSVFSYIADQEIHHRRMTFQEEFRALLNTHEIRFDERYVWD